MIILWQTKALLHKSFFFLEGGGGGGGVGGGGGEWVGVGRGEKCYI